MVRRYSLFVRIGQECGARHYSSVRLLVRFVPNDATRLLEADQWPWCCPLTYIAFVTRGIIVESCKCCLAEAEMPRTHEFIVCPDGCGSLDAIREGADNEPTV